MLFRKEHWAGLTDGTITLAFRKWTKPHAAAGRRMRFAGGYLRVDDVRIVDESSLRAADARKAGYPTLDALRSELAKMRDGDLYRITLRYDGEDERIALRADDELGDDEVVEIRTKLARLDKASARGPWTSTVLALIAGNEGVRAPDLAASLGLETLVFKRDVRKLKSLGLTESLPVGYRISPRGRAFLAQTAPP